MNPLGLKDSDISQDVIDKEMEIGKIVEKKENQRIC